MLWCERKLISLEYHAQMFNEAIIANFLNNEKILTFCVDKALLSNGKKYCSSKAMT